ncbi:iron ABC transporter permease [Crenobacter sp. SG2303]|uniref:Iron ABC transporter permease n=1 Tax=Crenobacter oryzisoli TaxID=3056844 RepID=A0ABT7XT71_9NEIS|nr:iron ABC transporter permease [Crenobacter sp. SG2303]MDN0076994.1 iron ABC transporter permease [Crenobacter sp. SG2303]
MSAAAVSTTAEHRSASRRRTPFGLLGAAVGVALLVLLPLVVTLKQAAGFGLDNAAELLLRPLVGELALNTLLIVSTSTIACAVIGTAAAWFVERTELPGRRAWAVLAAVPLAVPPFITSYAWVSLSQSLQDFLGALLVVSTAYYPMIYLPVAAALRGMDPALEESARSLGLGPWACFRRVILPQLKPALLGGMLLVALGVLSEFGAFALLRFRTFTTEIYAEYRASFDGSGAAMLASVLMLLCLVCLVAEFKVRGMARYDRLDRGTRRAPVRYALGWFKWPVLIGFGALTLITLGVPLGMILYWLMQHGDAAITPVEVSAEQLLSSTGASLGLGLAGALLTTVLALPLGYLLVRYPGRIATVLERVVYLAQGVPGIVIALAVVSLAIHVFMPLYQSATMLVCTYSILFLPLALVSVRAALVQAEPRLEDTARSLGLNWWQTLWRVTLPLAGPGLGAAAAMVFIAVVTELTATLLLAPIGTDTLAKEVWVDTSALAFAAAAPYAALLVAISLCSTWLLMSLFGKSAVLDHTQR